MDERGNIVLRRRFSRTQLTIYTSKLDTCLFGFLLCLMVGASIGTCQALPWGRLSSSAVLFEGAESLPSSHRPDLYTFRVRYLANAVDLQSVPKGRFVSLAKHIHIFNNSADMEKVRYGRILHLPQVNILDEDYLGLRRFIVCPDSCLPMGFSPGQNFLAMASLMIVTGKAVRMSESAMSRQRCRGAPGEAK
jgi:hypothetical protein